jgi:hypothetical protein
MSVCTKCTRASHLREILRRCSTYNANSADSVCVCVVLGMGPNLREFPTAETIARIPSPHPRMLTKLTVHRATMAETSSRPHGNAWTQAGAWIEGLADPGHFLHLESTINSRGARQTHPWKRWHRVAMLGQQQSWMRLYRLPQRGTGYGWVRDEL